MPQRKLVTEELASLLSVLSHPVRIRIIEELRAEEKDVNTLQDVLGISHSGVSQHLSLLKSRRLVNQRRDGRHVFYSLTQPELAKWLVEGIDLLEGSQHIADDIRSAIGAVRELWSDTKEAAT